MAVSGESSEAPHVGTHVRGVGSEHEPGQHAQHRVVGGATFPSPPRGAGGEHPAVQIGYGRLGPGRLAVVWAVLGAVGHAGGVLDGEPPCPRQDGGALLGGPLNALPVGPLAAP